MKKMILVLALVAATAHADMNPDGYIHGLSLNVVGSFAGAQPWKESSHFQLDAPSSFGSSSVDTEREHLYTAYGMGVDVKMPVTEDMTFLLGVGTLQEIIQVNQVSMKQTSLSWIAFPGVSGGSVLLTNNTGYTAIVNTYTIRVGANCYFKKLW